MIGKISTFKTSNILRFDQFYDQIHNNLSILIKLYIFQVPQPYISTNYLKKFYYRSNFLNYNILQALAFLPPKSTNHQN